jgi:hypothetical protein
VLLSSDLSVVRLGRRARSFPSSLGVIYVRVVDVMTDQIACAENQVLCNLVWPCNPSEH